MAKVQLGATAAVALLSLAIVSAQTAGQGRSPDRPLPNSDAARQAQTMTLSGCVVRDAANGGQPTIASNGISYGLSGKRDSELATYLGKRIEVTGTLESRANSARATSGKTDDLLAPKDQTAIGGQRDVPLTDAPRDNTTPGVTDASRPDAIPLATDKGTTADLTGRLRVKSLKLVAPNCL